LEGENAAGAATGPICWDVTGNHVLYESKIIPIDALEYDTLARQGQPRALTEEGVAKRLKAIKANKPSAPVRVTVWLHRPDEERYLVLGGQHTCRALRCYRDELTLEGLPVPDWCSVVDAKVLRTDTDLDTRERLAGDHQCEQATVDDIPLSRTAYFLAKYIREHPEQGVLAAIQAAI
jgi:hypothetical protein